MFNNFPSCFSFYFSSFLTLKIYIKKCQQAKILRGQRGRAHYFLHKGKRDLLTKPGLTSQTNMLQFQGCFWLKKESKESKKKSYLHSLSEHNQRTAGWIGSFSARFPLNSAKQIPTFLYVAESGRRGQGVNRRVAVVKCCDFKKIKNEKKKPGCLYVRLN